MAQDKTNSDGLLKDSYSNTTSEQGGWQARLKQSAHDAIDNLHDRLIYGTSNSKQALKEAADEPEAVDNSSEEKSEQGFKKARTK